MPTTTPSILAVLSLLHEGPVDHAAARRFRGEPVLAWTLRRVRQSECVGDVAVLCWDDQQATVEAAAAAAGTNADARALSQGPRVPTPALDAVSAARRWADGWRGGPLGTSAFDAGYHPPAVRAAAERFGADAVLLVDAAASLVDPAVVAAVVTRWREKPAAEFTFTPAATGLGCMLLPRALVDRLAAGNAHPGRVLHYFPDQVSREPIAGDGCAPTPTAVARSPYLYTLTSRRQTDRLGQVVGDAETVTEGASERPREPSGSAAGSPAPNRKTRGQKTRGGAAGLPFPLPTLSAEAIVARMHAADPVDPLPREVVLELTSRRLSNPIFSPLSATRIDRPDLSLDAARRLIDNLAELDDSRLTLAGVGDPLLHPDLAAIVEHAAARGVAVNVETDLLTDDAATVEALARSSADIVSVHLPALTSQTYAQVMGVDAYATALRNVQAFVAARAAAGRGTPLVVPLFAKCRQNLHEMEPWYDQWLRAVGSAVILGPSTFGGLVPDAAAADMTPPRRTPCRRLRERLTVLSDGRFVPCEQDVLGRQPLGRVGENALSDVWQGKVAALRTAHADNRWRESPLCAACNEWHRG